MRKEKINKNTVWYIKYVTSSSLDFKIYELQCGDKNTIVENDNNIFITLTAQRFENLINSLLEEKVLSFKDKYEKLDVDEKETWKLKIALYSGEEVLKQGINSYPENFKNVISILKKYGVNNLKSSQKEKINIYSDEIDRLFEKNMISRGINYYNSGVVNNLIKIENSFYSTLKNIDNYHIKININNKNDIISMSCDCPYEGNCKHEYAVILKIKEEKYLNNYLEKENDFICNLKKNEVEFIINILKNIDKVKWKKIKLSEDYKKELSENGFEIESINIPSVPDYPKELIAFFVYLNKLNFYDNNYLFSVSKIQNNRISDLDFSGIRTFLTYMYKQESTAPGLIARYIENGKLIQLLERLSELIIDE